MSNLVLDTSPERIIQIAIGSARAIMDHGWTRHEMVSDTGKLCAQGAIRCAVGNEPVKKVERHGYFIRRESTFTYYVWPNMNLAQSIEYRDVRFALAKSLGCSVVSFNDGYARRQNDLIDAFEKLAHAWEDPHTRGVDLRLVDKTKVYQMAYQVDHELAGGPSS